MGDLPPTLTTIPLSLLDLIASHGLTRRDLESLALTSKSLHTWLKSRRSKCNALLHTSSELGDLQATLRSHPALTSLHLLIPCHPLRCLDSFWSAMPSNIRELSLWQLTFKGRSAWQALASGCPFLATLSIKNICSEPVDLYTDMDPLSKLSNLKNLTVQPLIDDKSIAKLTTLTALSLSFPAHEDNCPTHLKCPTCDWPHLKHPGGLEAYLDALHEDGAVVMGAAVGRLPLLEELRLDFAAPEKGNGPEALLNRFIISEQQAAAVEGREKRSWFQSLRRTVLKEKECPWFPALRRLDLINVIGPRHFLYDKDLQNAFSEHFSDLTGMPAYEVHNPCSMYRMFYEWLPALEVFYLQASEAEYPSDADVGCHVGWKFHCGEGAMVGELVSTEWGLAYKVPRPKAPEEGGMRPLCVSI